MSRLRCFGMDRVGTSGVIFFRGSLTGEGTDERPSLSVLFKVAGPFSTLRFSCFNSSISRWSGAESHKVVISGLTVERLRWSFMKVFSPSAGSSESAIATPTTDAANSPDIKSFGPGVVGSAINGPDVVEGESSVGCLLGCM